MSIKEVVSDNAVSDYNIVVHELQTELSLLLSEYQSKPQEESMCNTEAIGSFALKIADVCLDIIQQEFTIFSKYSHQHINFFFRDIVDYLDKILKCDSKNVGVFYCALLEISTRLIDGKLFLKQAQRLLQQIISRRAYPATEIDIKANIALSKSYDDSEKTELILLYADMALSLLTEDYNDRELELQALNQLKLGCKKQKDFATALFYSKQSLALIGKLRGVDSVEYLVEKIDVGYFMIRIGNYKEAETCLLETYAQGSVILDANDDILINNRLYLMSIQANELDKTKRVKTH